MQIIDIFGVILVVVGLILTTNFLPVKFAFSKPIGWAMASIGMFLLFVCNMIFGRIIYAIVCLLFSMANAYFSVNFLKKEKGYNGHINQ